MQKIRIMLATHGYFAKGIVSSAKIIAGDVSNIETVCCYVDETINYEHMIYELLKNHPYECSNLIVITDLLGGSINTIFMKYLKEFSFHLISGLNLSLLLECMMLSEVSEAKIREIITNCNQAMTLCNDYVKTTDEEDDF